MPREDYSGSRIRKKTYLVKKSNGDTVTLKLAEVVPRKEAWLWKNESAFSKVMEGIKDAQKGRFEKVDHFGHNSSPLK